MTAIKIAVWADGNLFSTLWPYFEAWQEKGILDIVALAHMKDGRVVFSTKKQTYSGGDRATGSFCQRIGAFFWQNKSLFRRGFQRIKYGMRGLSGQLVWIGSFFCQIKSFLVRSITFSHYSSLIHCASLISVNTRMRHKKSLWGERRILNKEESKAVERFVLVISRASHGEQSMNWD